MNYAKQLAAADATLANDLVVSDWLTESFNDAKEYVYVAPIGLGAGPFTINDTYRANAKQVVERRIALAGARLAKILNEELK
jgi:hypothetical protein